MDYTAYAEFCRLIGYRAVETTHGVWIGPSHGFFNRVPLYETTPPTRGELRSIFRRYPTLGVNYAAEPGTQGRASCNYFVRDQDYSLGTLDSKGRWSVRKGLEHCDVRQMSFDELRSVGMPLNLDSLARQGRDDPIFSDPERWMHLCLAGERVKEAQAWGAFVDGELGAFVILLHMGKVVNLLYSSTSTRLMDCHPSPALFFTVIQAMIQTPGVEAVYNGPEWLTTGDGLDRFKQRLGFQREPVVFVLELRPLAKHVLLSSGGRRMISALGRQLLDNDSYQKLRAVLDTTNLCFQQ